MMEITGNFHLITVYSPLIADFPRPKTTTTTHNGAEFPFRVKIHSIFTHFPVKHELFYLNNNGEPINYQELMIDK